MNQLSRAELEPVVELLTDQGQSKEPIRELVGSLAVRYLEPWRYYHDLRHLYEGLAFLTEHTDKLVDPRPALLAYTAHDAIYVPQASGGANEELSARLLEFSAEGVISPDVVAISAKYVRSTYGHRADPQDPDHGLFLDTDLKTLGAPNEDFDRYSDSIRREYSFVPEDIYEENRRHVLVGFLERNQIYVTELCRNKFEVRARKNLERALMNLV